MTETHDDAAGNATLDDGRRRTTWMRSGGWWTVLRSHLPNCVALSSLAAVMWLGHVTGWRMPRMSALFGVAAVSDDWCADHLVAESLCIECNADLVPRGRPVGYCREHGVAECVTHHPSLAQTQDEPQLPGYDTIQAISLRPRPENNSRNSLHTRRVQFASAEAVDKAGVDVDVVQERAMVESIAANGEAMFDPAHVGHLSVRAAGSVAAVRKSVGDQVLAGEILALVDASQVGHAKSRFLQAIVQLQLRRTTTVRLRSIAESGALPHKTVVEAEAALQEAEVDLIAARQALVNLGFDVPEELDAKSAQAIAEQLHFLGIPPDVVATLPEAAKTANLIPVQAPFDGVIIDSELVAGEVVDAARVLFTIADPTRMWVVLHVRQEDAKYVRIDLPVWFQSDDGHQRVQGRVSWVRPAVDEQTRTLRVHVAITSQDGHLRHKTFGKGFIVLRDEPRALVVPREAVQSTPDASFVFVRDKNYFDDESPKFFHVRQVRIGAQDDQYVELLAGVLSGEVIACKGSNVLLAQLLRSNLGAGCGCHDK